MNGAVLLICATLSVYDGDTFYCNGETMRPMGDGRPHEFGFDTPEIGSNADCDKERVLGINAAKRFQDLLLTLTCHGIFPPLSIRVRPNLRTDNEANKIHGRADHRDPRRA